MTKTIKLTSEKKYSDLLQIVMYLAVNTTYRAIFESESRLECNGCLVHFVL